MGQLTTHVLDTANGLPANGIKIELRAIGETDAQVIAAVTTNDDGRCDGPLLKGDAFVPGIYELRFYAAAYFRDRGTELPEPAFLDVIPIRFGIADADEHYHVPLLISPYAYSTYRGS